MQRSQGDVLGDEALLSLQISRRSAVVSSATAIVGSIHASVYFQVRASANGVVHLVAFVANRFRAVPPA